MCNGTGKAVHSLGAGMVSIIPCGCETCEGKREERKAAYAAWELELAIAVAALEGKANGLS